MAPNIAKAHSKTQGLGKVYAELHLLHGVALDGVRKNGLMLESCAELRDHIEALMGILVDLETELDRLDKKSPCLKCRKIGGKK